MIPEKVWQFSQKFCSSQGRWQGREGVDFAFFGTFLTKDFARFPFFPGYVKRAFWNYGKNYAKNYAGQTWLWGLENTDLPVENQYFSTISTDFSTALFHRLHAAVYAQGVYIMRKM